LENGSARQAKKVLRNDEKDTIDEGVHLLQYCFSAPVIGTSELHTDPCYLRDQFAKEKLVTRNLTSIRNKRGIAPLCTIDPQNRGMC
jgi:hypothetical protein